MKSKVFCDWSKNKQTENKTYLLDGNIISAIVLVLLRCVQV